MLGSKKSENVLQKRIPKNPRYENVESTIDTGSSLNRYFKRIEDLRTNYRIRSDELFKRMTVTTFVQLVLQVEEVKTHFSGDKPDSERTFEHGALNIKNNQSEVNTTHAEKSQPFNFQGEIHKRGELNRKKIDDQKSEALVSFPNKANMVDDKPYLLLDVRSVDEYNQCHLVKSSSYPSAMISQSSNFETRDMVMYRNKPGKIIIIYDEDERIAPRVADTLVQRGYENLFLLSGGLKIAYKKFPRGLITGKIPINIRQSTQLITNNNANSKFSKSGEMRTSKLLKSNANSSVELVELKSDFTTEDLEELRKSFGEDVELRSSDVGTNFNSHRYKVHKNGQSFSDKPTASNVKVDHKHPFKC